MGGKEDEGGGRDKEEVEGARMRWNGRGFNELRRWEGGRGMRKVGWVGVRLKRQGGS